MRVLILLAIVAAASAATGKLELECEKDWHLFKARGRTECLRIMEEPMLFDQAMRQCMKIRSSMLSFTHFKGKIRFVNNLIQQELGEGSNATVWFFDSLNMHRDRKFGKEMRPEDFTVLTPAKNEEDVKLTFNPEKKPRHFMCEKSAEPVRQMAKFSMEPEDVQMSEEVYEISREQEQGKKKPEAFLLTFNCRSFALPKPQISWVTVNASKTELDVEKIEAVEIHDPREPRNKQTESLKNQKPMFFDLRRPCRGEECEQGIQQVSQLILVGAQFFDVKLHIACLASNEFGDVISREAQIVVTSMEEFEDNGEIYTATVGSNKTIDCELATRPDSASAEWFRIHRNQRQPIQEINAMSRGKVQMSKSTFDLVFDFLVKENAGDYVCVVKMHNGRGGFVSRERRVVLIVADCAPQDEDCDVSKRQLDVAEGYPSVLSMNPLSNEYIRHGDDFLMECPCIGTRSVPEHVTVEWQMPEHVRGRALKVLPVGSAMLIRHATEKMDGAYSCRCLSQFQQQTEWSQLNVTVLPQIEAKVTEKLQVKVNETAEMICELPKVDIDGIDINVLPMKGDDSLIDILYETKDTRFKLDVQQKNKYIIAITNVAEKDADTYGCRVAINYFNKWTEVDNYYMRLSVE